MKDWGVELLANTLVAGLGLLAINKKRRVLGAGLLGAAAISHSAAHSYISRYQSCSPEAFERNIADPPLISRELALYYGCTSTEAFNALLVGYALFPVVLIGALSLLFLTLPQDIPEECVLMRMLTQSDPESCEHVESAKILAEIEIEFHSERAALEEQKGGRTLERKQKLLTGKIFERLLSKVHENTTTRKLFRKTEKEMQKELKGALSARIPKTYYLRVVAGLCALLAHALLSISTELLPTLAKAFYWLCGIFLVAQGICVVLDIVRTIQDLKNDKFSSYIKGLSVLRTLVSVMATAMICVALFVPGLNAIFFPALIASTILGLAISYLQHREMKRLSQFYQDIEEGPLWTRQLDQAQEVMQEVREATTWDRLIERRKEESSAEYGLRLQEFDQSAVWLASQEQATEKNLLSAEQRKAVEETLNQYRAHIKPVLLLPARLSFAHHVTSRLPSLRKNRDDERAPLLI